MSHSDSSVHHSLYFSQDIHFSTTTNLSLTAHLTPLILGPDPSATLGAALDPLTSAPFNVHLIVMVLDRFLVELFPDLG